MVKKIKVISISAFIVLGLFFIKKIFTSNISSIEDFQIFMKSFGSAGPIVLTLIQALQVVIPVLPGYLGCAVGAISYGTVTGFICNYIGMVQLLLQKLGMIMRRILEFRLIHCAT